MSKPVRRHRWLGTLLMGLAVVAGPAAAGVGSVAMAQEEAPVEGAGDDGSGKPIYGYLSTAVLGSIAVFALCKSARR